jgi:hypothetical protein
LTRIAIALAFVVIAAAPSTSAPARTWVLLNAKNPTRSVEGSDVKAIFMGTQSFWNGVVPVKLVARPEASVGSAFFEGVLGTTSQRFQQHWTTRQLAGLGTSPEIVVDVGAACGRVRASPGAISVVGEAEAEIARREPGVKVLPIN